MKVKDLLKFLYPNQTIRILNYITLLDTGNCLKQADRIRPFLNYKVYRISVTGDGVLRIEVENNELLHT